MSSALLQAPVGFQPSIYQQAVFEHQATHKGHLFLNAVAGSGKSKTLIEAGHRLTGDQRQETLYCAFNRTIADELRSRVPHGVKAKTFHSVGMNAMAQYVGETHASASTWVNNFKYHKLTDLWLKRSGFNAWSKTGREMKDLIVDAVGMAMVTLTDVKDPEAVDSMISHFGILVSPSVGILLEDTYGTKPNFAKWLGKTISEIIEWGLEGAPVKDKNGLNYSIYQAISFDDMVYRPATMDIALQQFGRIYVDESQDLNAAQREFILKLLADGGQMIFCGDPRQAIYGFSGADASSIANVIARTSAKELPLSICYRCPSSILDLAREIVPHIENAPWAKEGVISNCKDEDLYKFIQEGDMVLCRLTRYLVSKALSLIARGVPAIVRGRDIGQTLVKVIQSIEAMDGYNFDEFGTLLELYQSRMTAKLMEKEGSDSQLVALDDRCESVRIIYRTLHVQGRADSAQALKSYIDGLFSDERQAVTLSTVHRAKGLEAERVFILHEELMPFPRASMPWQIEQEWNLRYVALTRAKHELCFVGE